MIAAFRALVSLSPCQLSQPSHYWEGWRKPKPLILARLGGFGRLGRVFSPSVSYVRVCACARALFSRSINALPLFLFNGRSIVVFPFVFANCARHVATRGGQALFVVGVFDDEYGADDVFAARRASTGKKHIDGFCHGLAWSIYSRECSRDRSTFRGRVLVSSVERCDVVACALITSAFAHRAKCYRHSFGHKLRKHKRMRIDRRFRTAIT